MSGSSKSGRKASAGKPSQETAAIRRLRQKIQNAKEISQKGFSEADLSERIIEITDEKIKLKRRVALVDSQIEANCKLITASSISILKRQAYIDNVLFPSTMSERKKNRSTKDGSTRKRKCDDDEQKSKAPQNEEATHQNEVAALEAKVAALEAKVAALKVEVAALEARVTVLDDELEILKLCCEKNLEKNLDAKITSWEKELEMNYPFVIYSVAPSKMNEERMKEQQLVGTPLISKELWGLYCYVHKCGKCKDRQKPNLIKSSFKKTMKDIRELLIDPLTHLKEKGRIKVNINEFLTNGILAQVLCPLFKDNKVNIYPRVPIPMLEGASGETDFLVHVISDDIAMYPCFFELKLDESKSPHPQMCGYGSYLVKKSIPLGPPFVLGVLLTKSTIELFAYHNAHQRTDTVSLIYRILLFSKSEYTHDDLGIVIDAVLHYATFMKTWKAGNIPIIVTRPHECPRVLIDDNFVYKAYKCSGLNENRLRLYQKHLRAVLESTSDEYIIIKYERVNGTHYPSNTTQVEKFIDAVKKFHEGDDGKLCHGDIRGYNVLFQDDVVNLIDFDFAGIQDSDSYPSGYSAKIPDGGRHSSARDACTLHQIHDWFAVYRILELMKPSDGTCKNNKNWTAFLGCFGTLVNSKQLKFGDLKLILQKLSSYKLELKVVDNQVDFGTNSPQRK